MLVKKHWHDFKVGQKLLWHLYGQDKSEIAVYAVKVKDTGPNYISITNIHNEKEHQHPVRIWEDELKNLEVING